MNELKKHWKDFLVVAMSLVLTWLVSRHVAYRHIDDMIQVNIMLGQIKANCEQLVSGVNDKAARDAFRRAGLNVPELPVEGGQ